MRVGWVWCARRVVRHNVKVPRRLLSTQAQPHHDVLSRATRNIGIIAHIDAVSHGMHDSADEILIMIG
jgi:elongation factor G